MMAKRKVVEFDPGQVEAEENFLIDVQFLIQDLMHKHGISQSELASRSGLSKARISQLMSSEANPTLKSIVGVFAALGEKPVISSVKRDANDTAPKLEATPEVGEWQFGMPFDEWAKSLTGSDALTENRDMVAVVKEAVASNDNYKNQVLIWDPNDESMSLEAA